MTDNTWQQNASRKSLLLLSVHNILLSDSGTCEGEKIENLQGTTNVMLAHIAEFIKYQI